MDDRLITGPFVAVTVALLALFVCVGVALPVLPVYVEDGLGGGSISVGLTVATFSLASIVVRPVMAPLSDRHGRRALMVGGALLEVAAMAASGVAGSIALLSVLRALAGIGEAAVFVGAATLISDLAPAGRRAEAMSYMSVAVFGGLGVGPVLGEAVMGDDRFAAAFLVAAAFALVTALLSWRVPAFVAGPGHGDGEGDGAGDGAAGVRRRGPRGWFDPVGVRVGAVLGLGIAGYAGFSAFVALHARHLGLPGAAGVYALYSGLCVAIRLLGARLPERVGLVRSAGAALLALTAGLGLVAAWATPVGLYAGTVVMAVGMSLLYPALMALAVNAAPDARRSAVVSTFTMFFEVGTAVGGVALGVVAAAAGYRASFAAGAAFALAGWALLVRRVGPDPAGAGPTLDR